ncbi:MAG: hypothetical protein LBI10_09465 [Deltaproteobacteria bacterium]|nr:hypothetical protein [Deltaproteobacteria bacterium]
MSFFSSNRYIQRSPLDVTHNDESTEAYCEIPNSEPILSQIPSEAQVRHESMLINEVSLILAEKRTALSVLRTGLAVLILPLSVVSVLVAVSRYYDPAKVIHLLTPLLGVSVLLAVFGLFLVFKSFKLALALDRLCMVWLISRGPLKTF